MIPVRASRASSLVVRAQAEDAAKKAAKPKIGPKRGSIVRILRAESFWFKMTGKVVTTDQKDGIKYPVVVRFETPNYYGISTNNYGLNEIEEVPADEYRPF